VKKHGEDLAGSRGDFKQLEDFSYLGCGLEIDFTGFPFFGDLGKDADHGTKPSELLGGNVHHAGAALDLGFAFKIPPNSTVLRQ